MAQPHRPRDHATGQVPFEAIIFDVDGTLVDDERAWVAGAYAVCRALAADVDRPSGVTLEAIAEACGNAFTRTWPSGRRLSAFPAEVREARRRLWRGTLAAVGWASGDALVEDLVDELERAHLAAIHPDPALEAALQALATLRPLAVCTDGWSTEQRDKLRRARLLDLFGGFTAGKDLGLAKPERTIFEVACDSVGSTPDRCLYVGNDWALDVLGAAGAGMAVAWITDEPGGGRVEPPRLSVYPSVLACVQHLVSTLRTAAV